MAQGRKRKFEIKLSKLEARELNIIAKSRSLPAGLVKRAAIILASAGGESNRSISDTLHVTLFTVGYWRKRFQESGIIGLYGEERPGRPRTHNDERVAEMIKTVLTKRPKNATHWTIRDIAEESGISKSTVHRYFKLFDLQPHRSKSFKLSTDPFFVDKVQDIVGLYLNPPDKALVLCVDEKSQIQALERTQPILPLGLGYVEGVTHNYIRHGTTTLFAALNVATGEVLAECKAQHRHQEFLSFLRKIDNAVPDDLDIHIILDNYATHKHPRVKKWLAARPRYHLHFTPTYASWLNQVERWFGIISQRAIRRGSFRNVKSLTTQINNFIEHYNKNASPFMWTATADSILNKLKRLAKVISGTVH